MRFLLPLCTCFAAGLWAQVPQKAPQNSKTEPAVPPETVIAVMNGREITAGEVNAIMNALPLQMRGPARADKKEFVRQYGFLMELSKEAEASGLHERSPLKESLAYSRMTQLAQAQLNEAFSHISVPEEDQKKYYEANRSRFSSAKVKVIYISFSNVKLSEEASGGKKSRTEAEALEKAERLHAELKAGADFVRLAKEHSEDRTSAEKDGDFGAIKKTDNLPDALKQAVFSLKPGEISAPIRQPNGYYIFRLEEIVEPPFEELRSQIKTTLSSERWKEWLEAKKNGIQIDIREEAFFAAPPASPAAK